jgi:hypothetical protein
VYKVGRCKPRQEQRQQDTHITVMRACVGDSDDLLEQSAMSDQGMGTMEAVRLFLGWRNCQTRVFA